MSFPTGIVEEFPTARTGKILGSNAFKNLLNLKKKIPGAVGTAPARMADGFMNVVVSTIQSDPTFWSTRFEVKNGEIYVVVDLPEAEIDIFKSKRWRARFVFRTPDSYMKSYRIDEVLDVPAFWLEELKGDEMP